MLSCEARLMPWLLLLALLLLLAAVGAVPETGLELLMAGLVVATVAVEGAGGVDATAADLACVHTMQ